MLMLNSLLHYFSAKDTTPGQHQLIGKIFNY
jgi:hypothetical protein